MTSKSAEPPTGWSPRVLHKELPVLAQKLRRIQRRTSSVVTSALKVEAGRLSNIVFVMMEDLRRCQDGTRREDNSLSEVEVKLADILQSCNANLMALSAGSIPAMTPDGRHVFVSRPLSEVRSDLLRDAEDLEVLAAQSKQNEKVRKSNQRRVKFPSADCRAEISEDGICLHTPGGHEEVSLEPRILSILKVAFRNTLDALPPESQQDSDSLLRDGSLLEITDEVILDVRREANLKATQPNVRADRAALRNAIHFKDGGLITDFDETAGCCKTRVRFYMPLHEGKGSVSLSAFEGEPPIRQRLA